MSDGEPRSRLCPRIASVVLVLFALFFAWAGCELVIDDCVSGCGDDADRELRALLGYVTLVLCALAVLFAVVAQSWLALGAVLIGGACLLTAFFEGMSHLT